MNGLPKILYENRLSDAVPVASTTAAGFDVLNLRDFRPYTWWKPTAMPATVTVDCGSAKAADYAVVHGHDLFTQGATIEVRASTDNFVGSNVLVATKTPTSDDPFLLQFASVAYRYWRFNLTGASAPALAIAAVGSALELPKRLKIGFDPLGRVVQGQENRSVEGHPLGAVIYHEEWSEQIALRNVTWTWLRATFLPAWRAHLKHNPFVFAWDPTDHADEIKLVRTKGQFRAPTNAGTFADLTFDVSGVVS